MVEGADFIKTIKFSLFVVIFLLIGGCSESSLNFNEDIEHFSTEDEALEHFIENERIKGNVDLVTTTKSESLLVTQSSQNTYFVGELMKDDEGVFATRISAKVHMEVGAAWELITIGGNKYTIFFEKDNEKPYLINLSNGDYYISIVEGHTLSKDPLNVTNAIKEIVAIKSN